MTNGEAPEILDIEQAAELLGVSIKTFNKVLHSQNLPARKIGREWKFSRSALIAWVGSGNSAAFYREGSQASEAAAAAEETHSNAAGGNSSGKARRTAGWRIEFD